MRLLRLACSIVRGFVMCREGLWHAYLASLQSLSNGGGPQLGFKAVGWQFVVDGSRHTAADYSAPLTVQARVGG